MVFELMVNGVRTRRNLSNVLYVPEATTTLISATSLARNEKIQTVIHEHGARLTWHEATVMEAKYEGHTLVLVGVLVRRPGGTALAASSAPPTRELWHKRMNHVSFSTLDNMTDGVVSGLKMTKDVDEQKRVCEACQLGKRHRNPFPHSDTRTTSLLEIIHSDLVGPINPPTDRSAIRSHLHRRQESEAMDFPTHEEVRSFRSLQRFPKKS